MNKRIGQVLRQQPTLWSDVFQAERGWDNFDNNDCVKDNKDEPRQGQGKQLGGGVDFKYDNKNDNEDATRTRTGEM